MRFKSFPWHMALPSLRGQDSGAAKCEALAVFFFGGSHREMKGNVELKGIQEKKKELNSAGL